MRSYIKVAAAALTVASFVSSAHAMLEPDILPEKRKVVEVPPSYAPEPPYLPELQYRIDESCAFILIVNGLTAPAISQENSWYNLQSRIYGYIQAATPPRCRDGKPQPIEAWRDGVSTPVGTYSGTSRGTWRIRLQQDRLLKAVTP